MCMLTSQVMLMRLMILISTYKEVTRTVNTAKRVEKQAQKKAVKAASVSASSQ